MRHPLGTSCDQQWWPLGATLLLLAFSASAQQQSVPNAVALEEEVEEIPEWTVEVIVFEYVGNAAGTTELFDPEPLPEPDLEPELEITLPARLTAKRYRITDAPESYGVRSWLQFAEDEELELIETFEQSGFRLLPAEELQLGAAYERLETLGAYRPLVHGGWTQPLIEQAPPVPIKLRRVGDPPLRLDGTFSLYLSRFLHLVVDLALEAPVEPSGTPEGAYVAGYGDNQNTFAYQNPVAPPPTFFRIQEDRIMRNNEVRYFDHPKFGVIARVMRIETPTEEELDTTSDLLPGVAN